MLQISSTTCIGRILSKSSLAATATPILSRLMKAEAWQVSEVRSSNINVPEKWLGTRYSIIHLFIYNWNEVCNSIKVESLTLLPILLFLKETYIHRRRHRVRTPEINFRAYMKSHLVQSKSKNVLKLTKETQMLKQAIVCMCHRITFMRLICNFI